MTNLTQTNSGERLTFFQLFEEKGYSIKIPIIQRDYAQGRDTSFEIRNLFLNSLRSYLDENLINRDLDFVYGSLIDLNFIPLDGQQRLTTLFLLHWYLAVKDEKIQELRKVLTNGNYSKFTYETRTSSKEFCDALIINDFDFKEFAKAKIPQSLSSIIKDSHWFYLSWQNDPTIKSILTMLDAIHEKFNDTINYFDRITNKNHPIITFQFLNLTEYKLTDDLYIKMNSRGKPLTPYENFKAKFEQIIKKTKFSSNNSFQIEFNGINKNVSVQEYFSQMIDTKWADLFWAYRDKSKNIYDAQLMNFIWVTLINHYAATTSNLDRLIKIRELNEDENTTPSFQKYNELESFNEEFIIDLITFLDEVTDTNGLLKKHLNSFFYYDEEEMFKNVLENKINNYASRVSFYAYFKFLIKWKSDIGLSQWMRVIHNLNENTIYNNASEFYQSIKSIDRLLKYSNDILNYLYTSPKIGGFANHQIEEEIVKAVLILKSDRWKNAIYDIEQHKYFKGQIGFILRFSQISDLYVKNLKNDDNYNWTDKEDDSYFNLFENYVKKSKAIFSSDGLNKFSNYKFERVLLSKGDYLLKQSKNYSFLIDNDRDISWKRLLRGSDGIDEKSFETKRNYLKNLFDDIDYNAADVESSLDLIIAKELKLIKDKEISSNIKDWRTFFIELPQLFEGLGAKKYIRKNSDHDISLLSKERMNSYHSEYYSRSFYIKYLKKNKFVPFSEINYFITNNENELPFASLEEWNYNGSIYNLEIYYLIHTQSYQLRILNKIDPDIFDKIILKSIITEGFILNTNYGDSSYILSIKLEEDLIMKINSLCKTLSKLK